MKMNDMREKIENVHPAHLKGIFNTWADSIG
jgi:hypothetical protein